YVVNRASLGKFNAKSNNIYQELSGALPGGIWSMPAFYNERLYFGPAGQPLVEFEFKNAKLLPAPVAKTSNAFGYPGTLRAFQAVRVRIRLSGRLRIRIPQFYTPTMRIPWLRFTTPVRLPTGAITLA